MDGPRALFMTGDESACSCWRAWQPVAELQRQGYKAHWIHKDDPEVINPAFVQKIPFNFDAVVLPRLSWRERGAGERYVNTLHKTGLAVIVEYDDDVFSPAIVQRQYDVHDSERAKGLEQLEQDRLDRIAVLQLADGVTVSSKRLATVVRQYVDVPVAVVPNAIDVRWWRSVLRGVSRVVPPLTVGWAGGARYAEDLVPIAEAWHNLAIRYPHVTFVVQGHMAEVLIDAVPADRVRRLPWLPIAEYPRAMLNIDIGCAGVADKHFNRCKTPIKIWEYALGGAVTVASPTLYGPYISDGEDGLIAETAAEWESHLARLVEDATLRKTLWREQRRRTVRDHSLENNAANWPAAWSVIVEDFRQRRLLRQLREAA